jgi:glutathione peroxidase-family protein
VRPGGGFVPNFQLFEKGDVNGENEQKVFTFLKVSEHNLVWIGQVEMSEEQWS